jgi:Rrf2 family iron-sulfur cluster assembly transcriptional regulator
MGRNLERRFAVAQLAEHLGASSHHLAKVMQRLSGAGLVESEVGRRGGFRLSRPPQEIALVEIVEAVDEPFGESGCMLAEPVCDGQNDCILGRLVQSLNHQVREFLSNATLAELIESVGLPLFTAQ